MSPKSRGQERRLDAARLAMKAEAQLASIDASAGPWWGFNGIKTLTVTEAALYVVSDRVSWFTKRPLLVERISRHEIERVEADVTPRHALVKVYALGRTRVFRTEEGDNSPGVAKFLRALTSEKSVGIE